MSLPTSNDVHPFNLSIGQSTLDDLHTRLRLVRWPDKETVTDWSQGVPLAAIQELCQYWQTGYDWRRCEALLNSYPQFTTNIDGVEFYFLHIRSKHDDALPLVLTHGWPGSVLEFRHVIEKLVNPESHGGSPEAERIEGHPLQFHLLRTQEVQIPIHDKSAEDRAMDLESRRDAGHRGYSLQQSTRPQTIGYGLSDSPVAQAAWIYEKYRDWSHHDGDVETVFSKDEMLDTIMLYWLSNSGTSSARYYWENQPDSTAWPISLPVGISWFGGDNSYAPKEWCERYYKNIVYWNETDRGGHFAAWEVPDLFVAEIREWRKRIRSFC